MDRWQPLTPSREEIRVLDIQPTSQTGLETVCCHLRTISLQDHPTYDALSYVWGSPDDPEEILLNGSAHPVTKNLHKALKALRSPKETRTLWVDAVCINQEDLQERNAQVSMMDKVYLQASKVIVFWQKTNMSNTMRAVKAFGKDRTLHFTDAPQELLDFNLDWDGWFFRAWTFQEAILARDLVFYAGDDFLTYQELEDYMSSLQEHFARNNACCSSVQKQAHRNPDGPNAFGSTMGVLMCLLDGRNNFVHQGKRRLLDVLDDIVSRRATDPRDLMYAFAGLANDTPPGFVRYDIPLRECIAHITSKIIEHSGSLEVLQYIADEEDSKGLAKYHSAQRGVDDDYKRMGGLPSWSPDWTQTTDIDILSAKNITRSLMRGRFSAGGKGPAEVSFPSKTLLKTTGVLYDTVAHVGKLSGSKVGWKADRECYRQWCYMLANSNAVYRAFCDGGCEGEITGARHKCTVCPDYDVCSRCLANVGERHPPHEFVTIELSEAPEIHVRSHGDDYYVEGSFWEMLDMIPYPHAPGESLQTAFRKTLTTNEPVVKVPTEEKYPGATEAAAFTKFWNTYIEGHDLITFKPERGLTVDEFRRLHARVTQPVLMHISTLVSTAVDDKRFFVTEKGYIGWGPKSSEVGDRVGVLLGAEVPFLLRSLTQEQPGSSGEKQEDFTLVGETYVHGIMDGEVLAGIEQGLLGSQTIVLH